jgi:hypothetical protein
MGPNPNVSAIIKDWFGKISATVEKLGAILMQPQYGHENKDEDQEYSYIQEVGQSCD